MASAINKDIVLVVSLVLSVVSLVLLFGVTWYFQSSLDLLQQQAEYDRELLFELQEQINNKHNDDIISKHDVIKRQESQQQCGCQCKNGSPGPIGPPGNKGEMELEGKQGVKGQAGPPGPRGDSGDRGPRGIIGDTGSRGSVGETGNPGTKGAKGDKGPIRLTGNKGDPGLKGLKGEMGYQGLKGDKGEKGGNGSPGPTGFTGPKGVTGQKGMKGDKEERNRGTVYVRWGHDKCPSTAQLVYSGRAGGSFYNQAGGGSNPQCLPLDPNFLTPISGNQGGRAYMYGAEYETHTDSNSHVHGCQSTDVPCAVCHVGNRTAVYMVPAKYTCPTGWTKEYFGYLMAESSLSVYLCGHCTQTSTWIISEL